MDCTADLLLVFVWGETASGTARSNIGNGMECLFFFWLLTVLEVVSSHTKRSISAVQSILILAPRCPRGSLVPHKSEEYQFCHGLLTERTVYGMCKVWKSVRLNDLQKMTNWLLVKQAVKYSLRPITSGAGSITEGIAIFVEHFIKDIAKTGNSLFWRREEIIEGLS